MTRPMRGHIHRNRTDLSRRRRVLTSWRVGLRGRMKSSAVILLVVFNALVTACGGAAVRGGVVPVQRVMEGPRADEVWRARFVQAYGRVPTSSEASLWKEGFDDRVSDYLGRHTNVLTSPRASQFRFQRQVVLGMTKEEVQLFLESPEARTSDETVMSTTAKEFWPSIKSRAHEMWVYPGGWQVYFAEDNVVDFTVTGKAALE